MLQIQNRYNYNGDIVDPDTYEPQRVAALEEFLSEIYSGDLGKEENFDKKTNTAYG